MNMEKESIILSLYREIEQEVSNSEEYKKLLSKFNILKEQLNQEITLNQQGKLNTLLEVKTDMESATAKDLFVEGFKTATKLMAEVFYKEDT